MIFKYVSFLMGYKGTKWSKTQYYRRMKKALAIGCSIYDLPDGRGRHQNRAFGKRHPKWNGCIVSSHGYVKIRVGKNHPLSDPNGYAYEHHVVWLSAGKGPLKEGEILHHINEDTTDNRLENLSKLTAGEHATHHNKKKERDKNGRFVSRRLLDGREWNEVPKEN